MNENGKNVLGILAGVAVGAILGILFAPDKGTNTRKKISKKGFDYAEGLADQFNGFIEDVTQKFEELKEEATETVESIKAKTDNGFAKAIAVKNL